MNNKNRNLLNESWNNYSSSLSTLRDKMQTALDKISSKQLVDMEVELEAKIEKKAGEINLEVSKKTDADKIIAAINMSPEKIKILARFIELAGYVEISDLENVGKVVINAGNITAGSLRGRDLIGCNIDGGNLTATDTIYMKPKSIFSADGESNHNKFYVRKGGTFAVEPTAYFNNAVSAPVFWLGDGNTYVERVYNTLKLFSRSGSVEIHQGTAGKCEFDTGGYFKPLVNQAWALGSSSYRWSTAYVGAVNQPSDVNTKENIHYLSNSKTKPFNQDITLDDCYNFIKDDYKVATYDYICDKEEEKEQLANQIGFVAQDIKDHKVSKYLLKGNEESGLSYNPSCLTGISISALQVAINKIEQLENKIKILEQKIN